MTTDIFTFWSGIELRDGKHPADHAVLSRVVSNFDFGCLPAAFDGPLRTAPVVLLYLSPGLSETQDHADAKSKAGRARYRHRWAGNSPLPGPKEHEPAWNWWKSRSPCFGDWQGLRDKIAVLNIGAYHSKMFADAPLLAALPSSRVSLGWAQDVLFPEAIAGRRVVVCLRAARFWGLKEGERYGLSLFAPPVTRAGHMKHGEMREEVIRAVKRALGPV